MSFYKKKDFGNVKLKCSEDSSRKQKSATEKKKDRKSKTRQIIIKIVEILTVSLLLLSIAVDVYEHTYYKNERVEYVEFNKQFEAGNVDVVFLKGSTTFLYTLKNENTQGLSAEERIKLAKKLRNRYETDYPGYEDFKKELLEKGVVTSKSINHNYTLMIMVNAPVFIIFALFVVMIFIMYKQISMVTSDTNRTETADKDVKFDDILGLDEILDDIKFTLKILTSPDLCKKYNTKPPKGMLLSGPPGTGKTMIAKAIANELNVNLISVDSSSLLALYAGAGAMKVRSVFKEARKKKPCIIFFDELDAIGEKRAVGGDSVMREYKQIVDALLQELDGFGTEEGIFVIGATNLESGLDDALTRAGRFSKKIILNPPKDSDVRKGIFEKYLSGIDLTHVDLDSISKQSTGFTGADIADICNEAKMIAIAREAEYLTTDIMEEALDKKLFKGSRTKTNKEIDKKITAYHECGHAISMLVNGLPISRITIIPNTSGVGGMVVNSDIDTSYYTKEYITNRIKAAYSGRIAEELVFGKNKITTGASSDIKVATDLIRACVENYGFSQDVGLLDITSMMKDGYINNKESLDKIHEISRVLYDIAKDELIKNRDILDKFVSYIIENETITGEKAEELFKQFKDEKED